MSHRVELAAVKAAKGILKTEQGKVEILLQRAKKQNAPTGMIRRLEQLAVESRAAANAGMTLEDAQRVLGGPMFEVSHRTAAAIDGIYHEIDRELRSINPHAEVEQARANKRARRGATR